MLSIHISDKRFRFIRSALNGFLIGLTDCSVIVMEITIRVPNEVLFQKQILYDKLTHTIW